MQSFLRKVAGIITVAAAVSSLDAWAELPQSAQQLSVLDMQPNEPLGTPVWQSRGGFREPIQWEASDATAQEQLPAGNYSSPPPDAENFSPYPDSWLNRGVSVFVGYDAFRGTSDGGWENNGIHSGANFGTRLGHFSDVTGIGAQLGGSMGVYNWSGTDYRMSHQTEVEPQGFVTYGLFRKPSDGSPWNAALVHDWMFNSNYSVFAQNPTLAQWRAYLGYTVSERDEFGVWGTWRLHKDTRQVTGFGPVTWRPLGQLNPFWHHKWEAGGADTWLWIGIPERGRLTGPGSLGDYLAGAAANCPLNDQVSLYTLVSYMHPSASPGPGAAREDAWNFTIGMAFYPGKNSRSSSVAGHSWMPSLPVANNGYFLVDASHNY